MVFTKKHYQVIAKEIYQNYGDGIGKTPLTLMGIIDTLGNVFRVDNPRFSYDKFEEACLSGGKKIKLEE
jgi:hypothetical protein